MAKKQCVKLCCFDMCDVQTAYGTETEQLVFPVLMLLKMTRTSCNMYTKFINRINSSSTKRMPLLLLLVKHAWQPK